LRGSGVQGSEVQGFRGSGFRGSGVTDKKGHGAYRRIWKSECGSRKKRLRILDLRKGKKFCDLGIERAEVGKR
jgi:hypothetical protein